MPPGTPRLSSIVQDELLQGILRHFKQRLGVEVWFQDPDGYTIAPETHVPEFCSILLNHGRCGLADPDVEMPADGAVPGFRTCVGGIGHLVLPITLRARDGSPLEVGRLVSEPMALRPTTFKELLPESQRMNGHPDSLSAAAAKVDLVDRGELIELAQLVTLVLQRVADERSNRARSLAVAEAFEEVGLQGSQEVIRELLAALVRDFSGADAMILTTRPGDAGALHHQPTFDDALPIPRREVILAFAGEVVSWMSRTGYPISFPDLSASPWRRHVLGGADLPGALVAMPVKLPGSWRGWWTAYYREPSGRVEEHLHNLSVLAAHSTQTLTFVAQLEESREAAMTDPLTGLGNRRFLHEQLEREMARSLRSRYPVSMVILDIDDFKLVNDTFGHRAGDLVLRSVADALRFPLRRSSTVCRYGGDEFCVIIPECTPEEALGVAARLKLEVERSLQAVPGVGRVRLRASAGVATHEPDEPAATDLFEVADQALLRAKRQGKDRVEHAAGVIRMAGQGRPA